MDIGSPIVELLVAPTAEEARTDDLVAPLCVVANFCNDAIGFPTVAVAVRAADRIKPGNCIGSAGRYP